MNSVNLELMQSLLQVTQQSKAFGNANTTTDSEVSFATILNDMNEKGFTLSQEEANVYQSVLEENNVDLDELHKILAALVNLDQVESNEVTEGNDMLTMLLEAFESEQTETEEVKVEETTTQNAEYIAESVVVTETGSVTESVTEDSDIHENEEQDEEIPAENVPVSEMMGMAAVNSSISIETEHEVVENDFNGNEEFHISEKKSDVLTYVAKPDYHEPQFDTDSDVIISDDNVLKLDLMFKDMFKEEAVVEESEVPILTKQNAEIISEEESVSDFEKAYMTLNTMRPVTQALPVDIEPTRQAENVNADKLVANEFHLDTPETISISQQIQNGFAKQVDLSKEFAIKLKPEGLGEIVVKMVSESDGTSSVSMITNNQQVKALLESDMADLRSALLNQNIEIKEVVYDDQSSYFSESNFMNQSNTGHSTKEHHATYYYQKTTDEQDMATAPTNAYYYGSSRVHEYA